MDKHFYKAPKKRALFYEFTALKDILSVVASSTREPVPRSIEAKHKHVLLVPGLGVGGWSFKPLSRFLQLQGFTTHDWGLGRNQAGFNHKAKLEDLYETWQIEEIRKSKAIISSDDIGIPYLCTLALKKARTLSEQLGEPISLIGWSLGGYIAREVARDLPEHVAKVITLASPINGGAKYTAIAWRFKLKGIDIDWMAEQVEKREHNLIQQPITSIYSRYDGIVHWSASIDKVNPRVQHHHVNASHLGIGFHYPAWLHILDALLAKS